MAVIDPGQMNRGNFKCVPQFYLKLWGLPALQKLLSNTVELDSREVIPNCRLRQIHCKRGKTVLGRHALERGRQGLKKR